MTRSARAWCAPQAVAGLGPRRPRRDCRIWIASGIVTATLLGGCAIGPDYKRPSAAEPQTFRGQATAQAASLADARWWEVFQDPGLRDLIHEPLRRYYDVRTAAACVREARAGCVAARSDLFRWLNYD